MKIKKNNNNKLSKNFTKKSVKSTIKSKKRKSFNSSSDELNIKYFVNWLVKAFYGVLCDNGKSVIKPLMWLFFVNFVFYQIYWMVFLLKKNCSLLFVFLKTLNPFFLPNEMLCIFDHIQRNQSFLRINSLQFLLNILLIFLLINSLFNKFFAKRYSKYIVCQFYRI